jgi:hypothetical protein
LHRAAGVSVRGPWDALRRYNARVSSALPAAAGRPRSSLAPVLLILTIVHVVAARAAWSDVPLQTDTGMWSYIGWRLLDGERLYVDLWETKPPGIYYVFAACVRLGGVGDDRAAFWLDALLSAAVLGLTFLLARRFVRDATAAFAVLLAGFVFSHRVLADWGDNVEKFVAFFEILAVFAALRGLEHGRDARATRSGCWWLFAGVCAGVGGLFKQTALIWPVAATLYLAFKPSWRQTIRCGALLWCGAALPWVVVGGWMWATGIFGDFWRLVVLYDLQRVAAPEGEGHRLLTADHWRMVFEQIRLAAVLLLPALLAIAWLTRRVAQPPRIEQHATVGLPLFALHALLGLLVFMVAPFGYGHYLLQIVPSAAVLAACLFQYVGWARPTMTPLNRRAVLTGLCVAMAVLGIFSLGDHLRFTFDPSYRYRRAYADQTETYSRLLDEIAACSTADDDVLIWPPDDALSYYAARRTPLQGSNADVLFKGKHYRLDPPFARIMAAIVARPPAVVVDRTPWRILPDPQTGSAALAVPADGKSLLAEPDPTHPRPEGRLVAPFQVWLRNHYGGQESRRGAVFFFHGRPWREWQEYLTP